MTQYLVVTSNIALILPSFGTGRQLPFDRTGV
jgi:hypothetical protein